MSPPKDVGGEVFRRFREAPATRVIRLSPERAALLCEESAARARELRAAAEARERRSRLAWTALGGFLCALALFGAAYGSAWLAHAVGAG